MKYLVLLAALVALTGCGATQDILGGSTHACGTVHLEGYYTDTESDIIIVKAPSDWTSEQIISLCEGIAP